MLVCRRRVNTLTMRKTEKKNDFVEFSCTHVRLLSTVHMCVFVFSLFEKCPTEIIVFFKKVSKDTSYGIRHDNRFVFSSLLSSNMGHNGPNGDDRNVQISWQSHCNSTRTFRPIPTVHLTTQFQTNSKSNGEMNSNWDYICHKPNQRERNQWMLRSSHWLFRRILLFLFENQNDIIL